jgi:hypothetical protein
MIEKFKSSINFTAPGLFHLPGQYVWVGGRCTDALFFARHRDYFIVTRNFTAVYQDLVPFSSFIVTLGYSAIYRDWQKTRHRDHAEAWQAPTAPN